MKKLLCLLFISVMILSCGSGGKGYELALITDVGTIDDRSFNQGAWEGLKKYAEEKKIAHKYYQPAEKSTDAYINAIDLAVAGKAKVIVTPGFLFETAVYKAQDTHPDVKFILLDGAPQDGTYTDFRIESNVYSVFYAEEQAGFLAGYAIVKEGYTNLGVMAGMAVPAVIRFGYGFVQGAEYAAQELGLASGTIKMNYTYVGNFNPTPENQTLATSWYQSGVQVIFAPAGGAGNSAMAAAEQNNGLVIGVDVDQSAESPTVITSAVKMLGGSVYDAIDAYYNDNRFKNFTKDNYDAIYQQLVAGNIKLLKDTDADSVNKLPLNIVKVNFIQ